jgi:hypothetical protein
MGLSFGQAARKPDVTWKPFPAEGANVSTTFQKESEGPYDGESSPPCTVLKWTGALDESDRVEIFYIGDVSTPPYKGIKPQIKRLKALLKSKAEVPALQLVKTDDELQVPFYETNMDSAAIFRYRVHYVDAAWGSGIVYLTSFAQDFPCPIDDKLPVVYVFQGLSKDGKFYVSGQFTVHHPPVPFPAPSGDAAVVAFNKKAMGWLQSQPSTVFTPDLAKLDGWLASLGLQ